MSAPIRGISNLRVGHKLLGSALSLAKLQRLQQQPYLSSVCGMTAPPHEPKDRSADADAMLFAFLPAASTRSGNKSATQTFILLTPMEPWPRHGGGGCGVAGLHLELRREPFVEPLRHARAPLERQTCGSLCTKTEHELAVEVHDAFTTAGSSPLDSDRVWVDQAVIRKVEFEDVALRAVRLTQIDESFGPLVAQLRSPFVAKHGQGGKGGSSNAVVSSSASRHVDFLGMCDLPPPRRAQRHAAPAPPPPLAEASVELQSWVAALDVALGIVGGDLPAHVDERLGGVDDEALPDLLALLAEADGEGDDEHGRADSEIGELDSASSAAAEVLGEDEEAEAAAVEEAPADPWGALLNTLGLVDKGSFVFHDLGGRLRGKIYYIGITGQKAVCKRHQKCECYVSVKDTPEDNQVVRELLVKWLASDAAEDAHATEARELKIGRGMRVRARR